MTNQFALPSALTAQQLERMFRDDEACAEDLFRRRWPDGFVCPDCGSRSTLQLSCHLGSGNYKTAWTLIQKIHRVGDIADGCPLVENVRADEIGVSYRLTGSEPPPDGRSHEGQLMITWGGAHSLTSSVFFGRSGGSF